MTRTTTLRALLLILSVCVLDIAIWAAGTRDDRSPTEFSSADEVRDTLSGVGEGEGDTTWLLLGDSVLAGTPLRQEIDYWERERVVDHMRREAAADARLELGQIALEGMLPVDMLHIVRELDRFDPSGNVGLVVEINPRYFSKAQRPDQTCTRPWICDLGQQVAGESGIAWGRYMHALAAHLRWKLMRSLPVVRHQPASRDRVGDFFAGVIPAPPRSNAGGSELEAAARVMHHYRHARVDPTGVQEAALGALIERLAASGRRALLFSTPLNDIELERAAAEFDPGRFAASVAALVDRHNTNGRVRFLSLDHPGFMPSHFLDHSHLLPDGARLLALNLLHELGVGTRSTPPPFTNAYAEGAAQSLVWGVAAGHREGAPWEARFDRPQGVAISPSGDQIAIADTGNARICIVNVADPIVRTRAGPRDATDLEELDSIEELVRPRNPVWLGSTVYFFEADDQLRRLDHDGSIHTVETRKGPRWVAPQELRTDGRFLYVLDQRTVLRFDPDRGVSKLVADLGGTAAITAFDADPPGGLWLVDDGNRVWHQPEGADLPELIFDNTGDISVPQGMNVKFPVRFANFHLENVVSVRWLDRYQGLLVQDQFAAENASKRTTARVHLRFLSLRDGRVYPWIKPRVAGSSFLAWNEPSRVYVSDRHIGSMDLDPVSGTLFYLERGRSRLLQEPDGLLGLGKTSHTSEIPFFGVIDTLQARAGREALAAFRPTSFVHRRQERLERAGPYLGVVFGSSASAVSDMVGNYSYARVLERELSQHLGHRDQIRLDIVQRALGGGTLSQFVQAWKFMLAVVQPDFVAIELRGRAFRGAHKASAQAELLREVQELAERYDTLVIFVDTSPLATKQRDGPRPPPDYQLDFEVMARTMGFEVVVVRDEILRQAHQFGFVGSEPFERHHASPWAIEAFGTTIARAIYPSLQQHLVGRRPSRLRFPPKDRDAQGEQTPILAAFDGDVPEPDSSTVTPESVFSRFDLKGLDVFVEVDAVSEGTELERLAVDAIAVELGKNMAVGNAQTVRVRIARFANHDEYGRGTLEGATILLDVHWDHVTLREQLDALQ